MRSKRFSTDLKKWSICSSATGKSLERTTKSGSSRSGTNITRINFTLSQFTFHTIRTQRTWCSWINWLSNSTHSWIRTESREESTKSYMSSGLNQAKSMTFSKKLTPWTSKTRAQSSKLLSTETSSLPTRELPSWSTTQSMRLRLMMWWLGVFSLTIKNTTSTLLNRDCKDIGQSLKSSVLWSHMNPIKSSTMLSLTTQKELIVSGTQATRKESRILKSIMV